MVLSCVIVEGISLEALQPVIMVWTLKLPQLRARESCTVRPVFVTALDGFWLRAILDEHGGLKRCYIFSHRMHNKHAQQSAVAILPCSWDSVCIGVIYCTTLNKAFFVFNISLPGSHIKAYCPSCLSFSWCCNVGWQCGQSSSYLQCKYCLFLKRKTTLCFCSDRLFYNTLSLAPSHMC